MKQTTNQISMKLTNPENYIDVDVEWNDDREFDDEPNWVFVDPNEGYTAMDFADARQTLIDTYNENIAELQEELKVKLDKLDKLVKDMEEI